MFTLLSGRRDDQRKLVKANSGRDRENGARGYHTISDDAEADLVIVMPALKKSKPCFLKDSRIS